MPVPRAGSLTIPVATMLDLGTLDLRCSIQGCWISTLAEVAPESADRQASLT
jgi:hypothetical protein